MVRPGRVLTLLLVSVIAGCGGQATAPSGSSSGNKPPPGPTTSLTAAIGVQEYAFLPALDSVKVGTTVVWGNSGTVSHTVTSDGGLWDSGQLASPVAGGADPYGTGGMVAGGTFQRTFDTPGTYTYHCANHAQMTGTIVVKP